MARDTTGGSADLPMGLPNFVPGVGRDAGAETIDVGLHHVLDRVRGVRRMASGTTGDVSGSYDHAAGPIAMLQGGWVLFTGLMLLFSGIWVVLEGIFAFLRSTWFIGSPVYGSLWVWALLWLVFGMLLMAAGGAVTIGRSWGRWFGILVVLMAALVHMASFATYPWWSAVMIAIDVLVLFGLTARWKVSEPTAAPVQPRSPL